MNWEAVGAIGEVLGAAAVVLSLAYLGTQIFAQRIGIIKRVLARIQKYLHRHV
jgi:hypothetical protein